MKIRAPRAALAETLQWVNQAVPKNPPQPVLAGIRLTAADGQLVARSFNYDVSHSARLDVDVVTEGDCLISGRFLAWVVGAVKGEFIELVLDGDELTISSGKSTYRGRVLKVGDFPTLPEQPMKVGSVDAGALTAALAHARLFVDNDAALAVLTGVHLEGDATELNVVGLRSAGANVATLSWECAKAFEATPLPAHMDAAIKGMKGQVVLGFEGGVLGLADETRSVTLRTLEGGYAQWRVMIREADDDAFDAVADIGELVDAVKRAGALCDDETPLAVTFGESEIEVSIAAGERGNGADLVSAECTGAHAIGMHSRFLLAGLSAMPPGPVRIGVGHREKGFRQPLVIRPVNGSGLVSLVMPKNLPGGTR